MQPKEGISRIYLSSAKICTLTVIFNFWQEVERAVLILKGIKPLGVDNVPPELFRVGKKQQIPQCGMAQRMDTVTNHTLPKKAKLKNQQKVPELKNCKPNQSPRQSDVERNTQLHHGETAIRRAGWVKTR